jgi:hypothetical protein
MLLAIPYILEVLAMSDNYLRLIPIDPEYVPNRIVQETARERLAGFVPEADEVTVETSDEVRFIHQGANWERVTCPSCKQELEISQWQQLMDEAYTTRLSNLQVKMSCCGSICSLNDLKYEWPAGFARFVLEAANPNSDLTAEQPHALE